MTVKELLEKLKTVDPDMEIFIEGRDFTGEYCDEVEMTDEHIYIGYERILVVTG